MQVVVNDTLVNYTDTGSGPILLCVHGWMHDVSSYAQLTEQLKADFRIISLDLPNFGASQMTDKVETVEEYAHFLQAFVNKLGLKDYSLVGHSMGCQIGIYGVGNGILSPDKLVLISAAGIRSHRKSYKKALKYASVALRNFVPKKYKKKFYKMIGSDYNPDFSKVHKAIISKVLSADIQADAKKINIPTLIINGNADHETPLWMAETLNREISHSTLEIIKNGDHWIHQKHADVVANSIRIFIS
ncbi:MAG: alpha/beta hydrolase [Candidatus Saccharibacteria bacterium]|nr:alpha/beta hydrolase [Candidatus Saccharibacteria bacterium]